MARMTDTQYDAIAEAFPSYAGEVESLARAYHKSFKAEDSTTYGVLYRQYIGGRLDGLAMGMMFAGACSDAQAFNDKALEDAEKEVAEDVGT